MSENPDVFCAFCPVKEFQNLLHCYVAETAPAVTTETTNAAGGIPSIVFVVTDVEGEIDHLIECLYTAFCFFSFCHFFIVQYIK